MSEPGRPVRLKTEVHVFWSVVPTLPAGIGKASCAFPPSSVPSRSTRQPIKYAKVDADTGEEVANEDIVKGYKVDTDTFVEVTKEELENVAMESVRLSQ